MYMFVVLYDFAVDLFALEVFLRFGFQIFGMRRVVADEGRLLLVVAVRIFDELDEGRPVRIVNARTLIGRRRGHHVIAI